MNATKLPMPSLKQVVRDSWTPLGAAAYVHEDQDILVVLTAEVSLSEESPTDSLIEILWNNETDSKTVVGFHLT